MKSTEIPKFGEFLKKKIFLGKIQNGGVFPYGISEYIPKLVSNIPTLFEIVIWNKKKLWNYIRLFLRYFWIWTGGKNYL